MDETRFDDLLARKMAGGLTAAEETELQQWLAISPAHQRKFREAEKLWRAAEPPLLPFSANSEDEWQRLVPKLDSAKTSARTRKWRLSDILAHARRRSNLPPALGTLGAVVLIAFAVYRFYEAQRMTQYREIVTANDHRVEVKLPDGSRVRLNSASRLRFPPNSSDSTREVFLDGEGYFQVAKAAKPFIVRAAHIETRVLGTTFNVYARDEQARVMVREGRVAVRTTYLDAAREVILNAGQMTQCRRGENPTAPQAVDIAQRLGWLEGKIVFVQTPLVEVAAELERFYNVPVRLAELSLGSRTLTATFEDQSLTSVLSAICLTSDLSYQQQEGKYVIQQ